MFDSQHLSSWWAQRTYSRAQPFKLASLMILTLLSTTVLLHFRYFKDSDSWDVIPADTPQADRIRASDLLSRPLASGQEQLFMPRYIHQSWMTDELPTKLSRWSRTCQVQHPEWQWVLWTDEDNLSMVEKYFPWFLQTYKALPAEINRADVARNMYMYLFGGVYADLDTECMRPLDQLFLSHGVSMNDIGISKQTSSPTSHSTAFFGRMGFDNTDVTLFHTIPNAWMAATPGVTLFLIVLEELKGEVAHRSQTGKTTAEDLTGPIALYKAIEKYDHLSDKGILPQDFLLTNESFDLFERMHLPQRLIVLPPENIYPYPWNNAGKWSRNACWSNGYWFNSKRCKSMVTSKETYTITYWSHTWNKDLGKTHNEHNLEMVGKG